MTTNNFTAFVAAQQQRINDKLNQWLPAATQSPERLHQAMRYSVLDAGKRIRPLLVYAIGDAFGLPLAALDAPAAAVEIIHCYSLIHDDLPAMDDDDLRRGKPTCHKAFDEATAILAGDALQALAFEILATHNQQSPGQCLSMLQALGYACGSQGMAGGQALDLAATGQQLDVAYVEAMHRKKTGALISASILLGAIASNADSTQLVSLKRYGDLIGLAFQIQDDILDIEGSTETLGKTQGADIAADKLTYPAVAGLATAKAKVDTLYQAALAELQRAQLDTPLLTELSAFLVRRSA